MADKDIKIECVCDESGAEFDIRIEEDFEEDPIYCPFCGSELPEEDIYEDDEEEDYLDELDFEKD